MNTPRSNGAPSDDLDYGQGARLAPAGFVDELGERSLSFDPVSETTVETLRLRREFAESVPFESALRARVGRVGHLADPALATIQSVERTQSGLLLISKYSSGRRLSELAAMDAGPGQAFEVIRRVTPALAALHRASPGSGHGALSLNRIVMTRDKRLIIVEHVLAPALEALHWSRPRFNDLGLIVPDAVPVRLDERADLRQLGWILLSLMLGRSLSPDDYPEQAASLFDEARRTHAVLRTTKLGEWLGRTLQLAPNGFPSAVEAAAAFEAMADDPTLAAAEEDGALLAFPSEAPPVPPLVAPEPTLVNGAVPKPTAAPLFRPIERAPKLHAVPPPPPHIPEHVPDHVPLPPAAVAPAPVAAPIAAPIEAPQEWSPGRAVAWIIGALIAVAVAEAAAILMLLMQPRIIVPARPVLSVQGALPSITLIDGSPVDPATGKIAAREPTRAPAVPAPRTAAPPAAQSGRINVVAAIELEVLRDNAVIGSTAAPLSLPAGRYPLVFANRGLGYRITQVVNVTRGIVTPVRITIPNVLINVNAAPWADVTIDGVAYGQTPLANVSLPIGSHVFVFRHPDLGERRQTVLVRADTPTLVTQNFR